VIARLSTPRWLAAGGIIALAAVVAIVVLLRSPACAAPPSSTASKGHATHYDLAGPVGSCNFTPPADGLYVALGLTQYTKGLPCGSYIDVTGPKGKVRVKVFDSCPECTVGWLDMSRTAWSRIASLSTGWIDITYKAVPNAATPGPLSITFAKGSSQYWWAVLIDNNANPIESVQAKGPSGGWMTASRTDYNFWIIDRNTGKGPFAIRMTDIYGHTATATGVKLIPEKKQATSVSLTGKITSVPAAKKSTPSRKPSASPSPSVSSSSAAPSPESATQPPALSPVNVAATPTKKCS
jgi:expansin (peptidoglycan-binding protein)